ncbi:hypothetical protein HME7025_00296 [Aquirufa nivalisilvae]|uniref:Uncharacterized protein n=1 Tax=Aquirufa nivalisilvae TaxID=2516557 RepID=A0A2S2DS98_9BACT|nr:hypothetical protein HME7025_00296 [Aquirufa nivalisilvae]
MKKKQYVWIYFFYFSVEILPDWVDFLIRKIEILLVWINK